MNKLDKLLFVVIVVLALFTYTKIYDQEAEYIAHVVNNNEIEHSVNLSEINEGEIITYTTKGTNGDIVIEFDSEGARIVKEQSPKNYCSLQGWSRDGQPIVCLPNNVYIEFESSTGVAKESDLDGVVQ